MAVRPVPKRETEVSVLIAGGQGAGKGTFLSSLHEYVTLNSTTENKPSSLSLSGVCPVLIKEKSTTEVYNLRFYVLRIEDSADEPISWKAYFGWIDQVIYICDSSKFGVDQEAVELDLTRFKKLMDSGFFSDFYNPDVNVPMMVCFNKSDLQKKQLSTSATESLIRGYKALYSKDLLVGERLHFCWTEASRAQTNLDNLCNILVSNTRTMYWEEPPSKSSIKQLISKKEKRFNRSAPRWNNSIGMTSGSQKEVLSVTKLLTSSYNVTELNFRNAMIRKPRVQELVAAVTHNRTLRLLNLSSNQLGSESMVFFEELLQKNSTLESLILQQNEVTNVGVFQLADALSTNKSLSLLDLSENSITGPAIKALSSSLQANRTLAALQLRKNAIGIDGYRSIGDILSWSPSLREVDLGDTMPSNEFEQISVSLALIQALTTNHQLAKDRTLSYLYASNLSPEHCATISSLLETNQRREKRKQAPLPEPGQKIFDLSDLNLEVLPEPYASGEVLVEATAIGLGGNKFRYLPDILLRLDIATSLRSFSFSRNLLSGRLSSLIARMHHLTFLDLSQNNLVAIPPEISALQSLESLDLRWNALTDSGMPIQLFRMKHLVHLKLQQNQITTVPEELFKMTKLTNVLLTGTAVPLVKQRLVEAWSNREVSLDLSCQELTVVPRELGFLRSLQSLNLRGNKLTSIPPEIGELTKLTTLDLSGNNLENLPWTIANLSRLETLHIKGNPLSSLPVEVVNRDAAFVKTFLGSLKDGKISCNRMKLMIVGQENVGKTSLAKCFKQMGAKVKVTKAPTTVSTDGIDIDDWIPQTGDSTGSNGAPLRFNVWDFAGQEVYYNTHQFFLTKRSIFLVVFNMVDPTAMKKVDYWMQSIRSRTPTAPVILVGTHVDNSKCTQSVLTSLEEYIAEKYKAIDKETRQPKYEQLKNFIAVSCKTKRNLDILQTQIVSLASQQKCEDYPRSFMVLENLLQAERALRTPPVISLAEFEEMASACNIPRSGAKGVAEFLSDLGTIVYFSDVRQGLDNFIVLDPQWLTSLLATLITTKKNFVKKGILELSELIHVWRAPQFPPYLHDQILALLESFGVLHRLRTNPLCSLSNLEVKSRSMTSMRNLLMSGSSCVLIPCLLSSEKPLNWENQWQSLRSRNTKCYERVYRFSFLPLGMFARLVSGVLEFTNPILFYASGLITSTRTKNEHMLMEFEQHSGELYIQICGESTPVHLIRLLVDSIEGLIQGWYSVSYIASVPCLCSGFSNIITESGKRDYGHLIPILQLETLLSTGQSYYECTHTGTSQRILIDNFAPDLTVSDFAEYMLDMAKVEIIKELGRGSFGTVSLATYNGQAVAVKKLLASPADHLSLFQGFRRELWIGSTLYHGNVVRTIGCCTSPHFCIVMELVPHGNLYRYIQDPSVLLGWPMRLKIALDIAKGMRFLHQMDPPMLHRDLKTLNVLLASLDPSAPIVAKVTDFGETRGLLLKLKGRENLLNPSWLAPELMLDEPYTEKADVFPFGIILWELMLRQHPYSEYPISRLQFTTPLETAIIQGLRPSFGPTFEHYPNVVAPLTPQPYARLAQRCWADDPEDRPSFEQIVPELRCLRTELTNDTSVVSYIQDMFPNLKVQQRRIRKNAEPERDGSSGNLSAPIDKSIAGNLNQVGFLSAPNLAALSTSTSDLTLSRSATHSTTTSPGSSPSSSTHSSPSNSGFFISPIVQGSGSVPNLSVSLSSTSVWRRVGVEPNSPRKNPVVGGKRNCTNSHTHGHVTMTAPPDCRSSLTQPNSPLLRQANKSPRPRRVSEGPVRHKKEGSEKASDQDSGGFDSTEGHQGDCEDYYYDYETTTTEGEFEAISEGDEDGGERTRTGSTIGSGSGIGRSSCRNASGEMKGKEGEEEGRLTEFVT